MFGVPCHWLIVDTFEPPTPTKPATHLYSRKGLKYSRKGSKRRLSEWVVRDVAQGWLQPTVKCTPSYERPPPTQQEVLGIRFQEKIVGIGSQFLYGKANSNKGCVTLWPSRLY